MSNFVESSFLQNSFIKFYINVYLIHIIFHILKCDQ